MRILATAALLLTASSHAPALAQPSFTAVQRPACAMAADDERWLRTSLAAWNEARRRLLKAEARAIGPIVVYDARCSYIVPAAARLRPRWTATAHDGQVGLPNGGRIPAGPNASNMALNGRNFVVMSLPSIWRPVAPKSEIPLEPMLESIMLHELAHAYQAAVTPELSFPSLQQRLGMDGVSDDSVEERYKANAAYVREYESERDLLRRAAAGPDAEQARELACHALASMRQRRARYFVGADARWSEVDELSLTTEGLGNWVAYARLTRHHRLPEATVGARLGSRYWSQEEGLALFLVIDRLVPGWQKLLFARKPETAEALLARACLRADDRP